MAPGGSRPALLLTSAPVFPSALRVAADSVLAAHSPDPPDVATAASPAALKEIPSGSYSVVLSLAERPGQHTQELLTEVARLLQPGGALLFQEPVAVRATHAVEEKASGKKLGSISSKSALERSLLLSGFASWTESSPLDAVGLHPDWSGITPASVGSLQGPLLQPLLLKAVKPEWSSGASFTLKRKTTGAGKGESSATGAGPASSMPAAPTWKLPGTDDDGEELVDEDALLSAEDLQLPPPPAATAAGCDPMKPMRKACKNCTCGRAEMEEKAAASGGAAAGGGGPKLSIDQLENPKSACGSCGLGDAFRCAGCPYRGLPPFKLGEKVTLGSAALSADA